MPRIMIRGLPSSLAGSVELQQLLVHSLPGVVENAQGFDISRDHVYVHAVPDRVDDRPGRTVVVTVEGLLARAERTASMRCQLCGAICEALAEFLDPTGIPYEAIVGWCVRIEREGDGFVRRPGPSWDVR